ncbi:UDP-N-acetylglucosamine 2-epimerase [alpha proteobacterium Q-1]|uniref:non-hydrolyzing UDP-N-acetylglucosamine 2-epimerase n=1 Tax=Iodidimonas nitroreducens TaxID=1236968 RepID=UPI0004A1927D|nr:UDP-N-acetylglucosamine 2-epimerase (non-hydrolyzing) [Iodidimonas nitroreducens]GAK32145.1 UDP-N-acetylglucosamine 2-epimerase [alpha proteobacterium Q-1]
MGRDFLLRIMSVIGTRPEAIKMAPLIASIQTRADFEHCLCLSGQHRDLVHPVLAQFGISADHDLEVMSADQSLTSLGAAILEGIGAMIQIEQPDWMIVQGDTSTSFAAALAAFYAHIPLLHLEAGLRSGDRLDPWPEESHRKMIAPLAHLHAVHTLAAQKNLEREGIDPRSILISGNSGIDAVQQMCTRLDRDEALAAQAQALLRIMPQGRRLIYVTCHRREKRWIRLKALSRALVRLAARGDVEIIVSVHPSPEIDHLMRTSLADVAHVHLLNPLDYASSIHLLRQAHFVISDSGGMQEEAPYLGKPILVLRESTERQEAVDAGAAILVGHSEQRIHAEACRLLDHPAHYAGMARRRTLFGDGHASERIIDRIAGMMTDAWVPETYHAESG